MNDIEKFLSRRPLLFDGGMGTDYKAKPGQECEQANLTDPGGHSGGAPGVSGCRGGCHQDQYLLACPVWRRRQQPGLGAAGGCGLEAGSKGRRGDRRVPCLPTLARLRIPRTLPAAQV